MTQSTWKEKIGSLFNMCQSEVKKTTKIGQKMISASQTNTCLKESYSALGEHVAEAMKDGALKWEDEKAKELLEKINQCKDSLDELEKDVNNIKFHDENKTEH